MTISGATATFLAAQPDNIGVGDVIQFGGAGYYDLAFITGRISSTEYSVQAWDGSAPIATTTANMNIYRAHLELNDWSGQTVVQVNSGIDSSIEDQVLVGMDLVASNTIMMVPCYASANGDGTETYIQNWTTGVANYINVYTPVDSSEVGTSQRHFGKWNADKYYIELSNVGSSRIRLVNSYIKIIGTSNHWLQTIPTFREELPIMKSGARQNFPFHFEKLIFIKKEKGRPPHPVRR